MKVHIEVEFGSSAAAKNAAAVLAGGRANFKRDADARIRARGNLLGVDIAAEDASVLQAATNSYFRLIKVAKDCEGV